jgi:hypothetical protein
MRAFKAGVIYFLLAFAVGLILGPIRELWALPHFGCVATILLEVVIMLIAMVVSARWGHSMVRRAPGTRRDAANRSDCDWIAAPG